MSKPQSLFFRVAPKAFSEGYCCLWGYLKLCRARGETRKSMSEFSGLSVETIKNHYRRLKRGEHSCQEYPDCLRPVIEDIDPGPSNGGDNPNRP
jgi:hypothetical protein